MEIFTKQKDIYFIIRSILCPSLFIALAIVSCNSSGQVAGKTDNKPISAASYTNLPTEEQCNPDMSFVEGLSKQGFSLSEAELIKKEDIPNLPDNIKAIEKLFEGQEDVFKTFYTLNRYHIKKHNSNISARFYCFKFLQKDDAQKWFDAVTSTPSKNKRLVTFSKPKKLMALSKNHVYLVEGYHIADYSVLHLIIEQIPEVDAVLGPK